MEKLYYYFKDASIEKVKELISQCELRNCEDNKEKEFKTLTDKKYINNLAKKYFKNNNFKYVFCLTKDEILENKVLFKINKLIFTLEKNGIKKENMIFSVLDNSHRFSKDEWNRIEIINNYLKQQSIKFGFEDHGKTWDIFKVKNANKQINKTALEINSKNLSPFEKIMAAYFKVTSRVYNAEGENEHMAVSRSVYGLLNSTKIVCVGYSEWLADILKLTNDSNIKVYQNGIQIAKNNKYFDDAHRNTIIYVKDKKYNIDGYYYVDPTWDTTIYQNKTEFNLNNFMIPLSDINEYKFYIRADQLFLDLPDEEEYNYISSEHKKNLEYKYGSLLSPKHNIIYGYGDENNNVSFSIDKYYYDGTFLNDIQNHIIQYNTYKDFSEIEFNNNLNKLNDVIDRNKDTISNLKFIKKELLKNNIKTLTHKDIVNIANSNNYVNTIIDIICNNKQEKSKAYPLNTALTKLTIKLNNQQKKLEKEVKKFIDIDFSEKFNEENFEFFNDNVLDETIKYLSTPIPLNKITHALKVYFDKFTDLTQDAIEEKVEDIIDDNIYLGTKYQKATAQNAFTQNAISIYGDELNDLDNEEILTFI